MGELQELGLKHNTDKATIHHYLDFYQGYLPDRDFEGRLLEIGIRDGASLRMWREYYPNAQIIGLDVVEYDWTIEGVEMLVLDGSKSEHTTQLGKFDVIIDDGSHLTSEQQRSFQHLYYHQLNAGGIYILEDLHTSLMPEYVDSPITTLEYLDRLNIKVNHWRRDNDVVDSMTSVIKAGQ